METTAKCAPPTRLKSKLEMTPEPLLREQTQLVSDTTQFARALEELLLEQDHKHWLAVQPLSV